jgi:peptidoglycan/LPS O-acetylase OafA/YrhL
MLHVKYRPDIDGLRAIAVLSVICFHAFPKYIQGGFAGVDIFFVISGFLISGIIFDNLEKNSFSYIEFYSRRIRRIFPALIVVLSTTLLFGWYILFPDELSQLGKHVAGAIGFVSNFVLYNEAGYFDTISETKPLLHLWSLGVEEQFYIFWPLLLGLAWKYKSNLLIFVVFIAAISFCANLYTTYAISSEAAFYWPTNRFWELMIGGILAYAIRHKQHGLSRWLPETSSSSNFRATLGTGLIIVAIGFLDRDKVLIGGWALVPTLGAFLLISTPGSWLNQRVLSHRAMVYIGLISFPLYLWHWSVLSMFRILQYTSYLEAVLAIIISFALAALTYEFIEKNIRKHSSQKTTYFLVVLSVILLLVGLSTLYGKPAPRNNSQYIAIVNQAIDDWEYPDGLSPITINNQKLLIKSGTEQKVLFWGDSHIEQYAPRIVQLIDEHPDKTKTAVFATRPGCPPIPGVYEDHHRSCSAAYRDAVIKYALSPEIDSVVIGFSARYLSEDEKPQPGEDHYYYLMDGEKIYFDEGGIGHALQSLEEIITKISAVKNVFLITDNPSGNSFDPKAFINGSRLAGYINNPRASRSQKYDPKQAALQDLLTELAERTQAQVIDAAAHFCQDGTCATTLSDGTPIYKDDNHIRPFYVKEHIDYIDVTLKTYKK